MVDWNPDIIEISKLQILDEHTDITYQVTKEAGGGLIGRRDFVSIRHWKMMENNTYFIATKKTEHPSKPTKTNNEYIRYYYYYFKFIILIVVFNIAFSYIFRAELGINGYVLSPIQGESDKCLMQWFMNLNLNGQIPKLVVNGALIKVMLNFATTLKTHLSPQKN